MLRALATLTVLTALLAPDRALAHGFNPSMLELREETPTRVTARFRTPLRNDESVEALTPHFDGCRDSGERSQRADVLGQVLHLELVCPSWLAGTIIHIQGMRADDNEVLVRLQRLDGETLVRVVRGDHPELTLPARASALVTLRDYARLGVSHILGGPDHLLFVLGLVLLVRSRKSLAAAITAFTLAHSLTLSAAVLGLVHCPQRPAEVVIALSILLLAVELARRADSPQTLSARFPWAVAFIFGLVHGFGFSGALAEVGLPPGAVPLALLGFNGGVELGQLVCVAALLLGGLAVRKLAPRLVRNGPRRIAYAMGPVAMFWFCERLGAFWR